VSDDVVVVDENDLFIRNAPRKQVHQSDEWHRGVHCFLFNAKGELLVMLRSAEKDKYPLHWECLSEHVNPGESYEEALRRGLSEELGITNIGLKKFVKFRMHYGPGDNMVAELYTGEAEGYEHLHTSEVERAKFRPVAGIKRDIDNGNYTPWFKAMFKHYMGMPSPIIVMQ